MNIMNPTPCGLHIRVWVQGSYRKFGTQALIWTLVVHQTLEPETLHQRRRPDRLEESLLVSCAFNPVPDASNERNCHLPQRNPTYSEAVDELLVRGVLACGSFWLYLGT